MLGFAIRLHQRSEIEPLSLFPSIDCHHDRGVLTRTRVLIQLPVLRRALLQPRRRLQCGQRTLNQFYSSAYLYS